MRELWRKNLIPIKRVTALERDAARLEGERGTLVSTMAQTKGKITETELQILQIEQDLRTEVGKDLAEIRGKTVGAGREEGRGRGPAQAGRHPRAPGRDGAPARGAHGRWRDHAQGEPIMLIVPEADALTVEAKIAPQDIDQVRWVRRRCCAFPPSTSAPRRS